MATTRLDIYDALLDGRKPSGDLDQLIKALEGVDARGLKHLHPSDTSNYLTNKQYDAFRKAYYIVTVQRYALPDAKEIILAAAGLLEGYDNILTDNSSDVIQTRLRRYLRCSGINKALGTLSKYERNKLNTLADVLSRLYQENKLSLCDDVFRYLGVQSPNDIPETITLPTPSYIKTTTNATSQQNSNIQSTGEDAEPEQSTTAITDIDEIEPEQKRKLNATNWLSILCAVLCVICLIVLPIINSILTDTSQVIQDIDVAQSQITLYPGGSERLKIYTAPEDADIDGLECHSDSNPLITADKSNDWVDTNPWTEAWRVAAEKNWTEIFPYNAKVSVMGGDAIPVYVDITVEQPSYIESADVLTGNNTDDGTGEKTDVAP